MSQRLGAQVNQIPGALTILPMAHCEATDWRRVRV